MKTLSGHIHKTAGFFFRTLVSAGIVTAVITMLYGNAFSQGEPGIVQYTAFPPFGGRLLKPNVLLNLDISTSQYYFAYDFNWNARTSGGGRAAIPASKGFAPSKTYYGYFASGKNYSYTGGEFVEDPAGPWNGNFLNWLTTRRADILKKALVGGRTRARSGITGGHPNDILGKAAHIKLEGYEKELCVAEDGYLNAADYTPYSDCPLTFTFDNATGTYTDEIPYFTVNSTTYYIIIHSDTEPEGVFQRVGGSVRWGLELMTDGTIEDDGGGNCRGETGASGGGQIIQVDGGTVVVPVGYYQAVKDKIVNTIADSPFTSSTPIAESLWTATGYFAQDGTTGPTGPRYPSNTYATGSYPVGNEADPYNYAIDPSSGTRWEPCAKSFVITITDGEPTADLEIPAFLRGYGPIYADSPTNPPAWADTTTTVDGALLNYFWAPDLEGSHFIDNVALYGHTDYLNGAYRDLRDDVADFGLDADRYDQNLTHYFIYVNFGGNTPDGRRLLNWPGEDHDPLTDTNAGGAARNGGFTDSNGNFLPDLEKEYDSDKDANNDNFFEAKDGYQLEAALINAVYDALKRTSSGTAASVLVNQRDGEGAVYQAYFIPEKMEDDGIRKWRGFIHALFVDKYGNLREDAGTAGKLDNSDPVIKMDYSPENGTEVYRCATTDNGATYTCPSSPEPGGLESIRPIWDGGRWLWENNPARRKIYTTLSGYDFTTGLNIQGNPSPGNFHVGNSAGLQPYLRAADIPEAARIIRWIRGEDISGYRERSITLTVGGITSTNVWKLGDIIHSDPTVVGQPMENMDLLYSDSSYTAFRKTYLKRRQVVYAGANDGMLHAFNAGCYDEAERRYYPDVDSDGECISGSRELGQELWAFIPRGLLPHLKWLTDPEYTHVYYVDLKPKVADVKIFNADSVHVNKWGTILIGGFNYGGKKIEWTSGNASYSASPEYFALDITDPLNPRLLWTFSDPDLGLSMSYPAVAKVGNNWYAVFGSGATDYDATSDLTEFQNGNIFVLKISGGNNGVVSEWIENRNFWKIPTGSTNSFMADPISVDVNLDYQVDVIYIGENHGRGAGRNAVLRRITTAGGSQENPALWQVSTVADINVIAGTNDDAKRITAASSAAMDDNSNLWVYFGTGQFMGASDNNQTDTGGFYAIKDGCWDGSCTVSYTGTDLLDVSRATVGTDGSVAGTAGACAGTVSSWSNLLTGSYGCKGWVMYFKNLVEDADFTGEALAHNGERVISKPLVFGGLVLWSTYIPGENSCSYEGESNVYAVYYETGTAYSEYVFKQQEDLSGGQFSLIARVKKLGAGVPSSIGGHITEGGTAKGFSQQSTGSILETENILPISLQSKMLGCQDEAIR